MWWHFGRVKAFRPEGRVFESRSSRHEGTLSKSLTRSCLWRFGVKFRRSIRAQSFEDVYLFLCLFIPLYYFVISLIVRI